jgi:hypothetical protein
MAEHLYAPRAARNVGCFHFAARLHKANSSWRYPQCPRAMSQTVADSNWLQAMPFQTTQAPPNP